jgi:hypothetical protein
MYTDRNGKEKKFVLAYDTYLALKSKIYNLDGNFDMSFVLSNLNEQNQLLDKYVNAREYAKKLHYARNNLNTGLPSSIQEAEKLGWSTVIATYHQNNIAD